MAQINTQTAVYHPASFRDPAGRIVTTPDGRLKRFIADAYKPHYHYLMSSDLYYDLTRDHLLIEHRESVYPGSIEPEMVPFISYPYEWTFRELKQAAMATLLINTMAIKRGMILKDASAFNIQWRMAGKDETTPVLIDTLSFEILEEGQPWRALHQFVQHFLYPLLLAKTWAHPQSWQSLEGITSEDIRKVLPLGQRLSPKIAPFLYGLQNKLSGKNGSLTRKSAPGISRGRLLGSMKILESLIYGLKYNGDRGWSQYKACSYTTESNIHKQATVAEMISQIHESNNLETAIDLGANTGYYTSICRKLGVTTIAIDSDYDSANRVEPLSLVADLCNPPPGLGWANKERSPLLDRLREFNKGGLVLALALIHHLCLGRNVPIAMVLDVITSLCKHLIIEFIPPDDPMAKKLTENHIAPEYNRLLFVTELNKRADIREVKQIKDTKRELFYAVCYQHTK